MSTPITNTSQMTAAKLSSYRIQDDGGLAELSKAQRFGRRIADFCRSTMKPEGKFQIAARNHQVAMKIASLKSNETLAAQGANNESLHRSTNIAINALRAKVASAPNLSAETRRQVDACLTAKLREAVSTNTLRETARAKGVELFDKFLFSNVTVNQNAEANNALHVALTNAHREENPEEILNIFARDTYPSGLKALGDVPLVPGGIDGAIAAKERGEACFGHSTAQLLRVGHDVMILGDSIETRFMQGEAAALARAEAAGLSAPIGNSGTSAKEAQKTFFNNCMTEFLGQGNTIFKDFIFHITHQGGLPFHMVSSLHTHTGLWNNFELAAQTGLIPSISNKEISITKDENSFFVKVAGNINFMGGGIEAPGIGDSRCTITVEIPMDQPRPAAGVAPEDGLFVPEFTVNVNLTHAVT